MIVDTFTNRLNEAIKIRNIRQVDLIRKTKEIMKKTIKNYQGDGIDKSLLSKYINGIAIAKQDNLYVLAKALDVSEAWLMGFDVDMDREWFPDNKPIDEETFIIYEGANDDQIIKKYQEVKNKLTDDDKETILFILNKRSNDKNT